MRKKIALIAIMQIEKSSAGAARVAHHQIRWLRDHGFEVHLFADRVNVSAIQESGAILHRAWLWKGTGYLRRKLFSWQAARLVRKLKPDLTVGHGDIHEQDVLFLHNCVHLANELIEGRPLSKDHEMYRAHTPMLRTHSGLIAANSQLMKKDLVERFQKDPRKIEVIYPAFDQKKFFAPSPFDKSQLKAEFNIPSEKFLIGLVTSGNFK